MKFRGLNHRMKYHRKKMGKKAELYAVKKGKSATFHVSTESKRGSQQFSRWKILRLNFSIFSGEEISYRENCWLPLFRKKLIFYGIWLEFTAITAAGNLHFNFLRSFFTENFLPRNLLTSPFSQEIDILGHLTPNFSRKIQSKMPGLRKVSKHASIGLKFRT